MALPTLSELEKLSPELATDLYQEIQTGMNDLMDDIQGMNDRQVTHYLFEQIVMIQASLVVLGKLTAA